MVQWGQRLGWQKPVATLHIDKVSILKLCCAKEHHEKVRQGVPSNKLKKYAEQILKQGLVVETLHYAKDNKLIEVYLIQEQLIFYNFGATNLS